MEKQQNIFKKTRNSRRRLNLFFRKNIEMLEIERPITQIKLRGEVVETDSSVDKST